MASAAPNSKNLCRAGRQFSVAQMARIIAGTLANEIAQKDKGPRPGRSRAIQSLAIAGPAASNPTPTTTTRHGLAFTGSGGGAGATCGGATRSPKGELIVMRSASPAHVTAYFAGRFAYVLPKNSTIAWRTS